MCGVEVLVNDFEKIFQKNLQNKKIVITFAPAIEKTRLRKKKEFFERELHINK